MLNIHAFDATKNAAIFKNSANTFGELATDSTGGKQQQGLFHIETNADGKIIPAIKKKKKGYSIGGLRKNTASTSTVTPNQEETNLLDKSKVSTVSLTSTSLIDLDRFNMWMGQLLQEKGNDLYRFKGILAMENYEEKFVVQGKK